MGLVLNRKLNQAVIIDDRIRIIVVEIKGNSVRLEFDGDPDCRVLREEIYLKELEEKKCDS